jgi:hypothetical protein
MRPMALEPRFGLLGPLLVRRGEVAVPIPAGKQRVLLAALLLSPGRALSADELADLLWEAGPPPSARGTVHNYVKRLRRALDDADRTLVTTQADGYLLRIPPGEVDIARFEMVTDGARQALRAGRCEQAARELRDADPRRDPALDEPSAPAAAPPAPAPPVVPRQLPPAMAHFAGREPEQDGQLYVNLRGFGPEDAPMAPAEGLADFVEALRPSAGIPGGLDARAGLYRSLTAGKRLLVILDNARDADQVRPLLPGSPGCMALITSRDRLAGLAVTEGAALLTLEVLPEPEARALVVARAGEGRAAAQPGAVAQITELCGRLPLAGHRSSPLNCATPGTASTRGVVLVVSEPEPARRPAVPAARLAPGP